MLWRRAEPADRSLSLLMNAWISLPRTPLSGGVTADQLMATPLMLQSEPSPDQVCQGRPDPRPALTPTEGVCATLRSRLSATYCLPMVV